MARTVEALPHSVARTADRDADERIYVVTTNLVIDVQEQLAPHRRLEPRLAHPRGCQRAALWGGQSPERVNAEGSRLAPGAQRQGEGPHQVVRAFKSLTPVA